MSPPELKRKENAGEILQNKLSIGSEEAGSLTELLSRNLVGEFSKAVDCIVREYFASASISEAAEQLRDLNFPEYHHFFVKKLVSMAMDRNDRKKEMAAVLLSALHADVIPPSQMVKGFLKLLQAADDLVVDIPDAVDVLAVFVARAVVDDILPPVFISDAQKLFTPGSKGLAVVEKASKNYLVPPVRAQLVEQKWGGSSCASVELAKKQIDGLLQEYLESGDKAEACHCIRQLEMPFYHHQVVKRSLLLAMEKSNAGSLLMDLLRQCAEEGLVSSSQMTKGFSRVVDSLDDLVLDIPDARALLEPLVSRAIQERWLTPSFKASSKVQLMSNDSLECNSALKEKLTGIIQEYFLSDDVHEALASLKDMADAAPDVQALFMKRLILLAMERKNREKEMTSVLLPSLSVEVEPDQVVKAFTMLLEGAEDTCLDIPDAANQLVFFLARAVFDDVLPPFCLEEMKGQLPEDSLGRYIVATARSLLSARHSGERIVRCWGGGSGWAIEDAKDKIFKMLEEYEAGGDIGEACRCIRELDMPFFHHEIVKSSLEMAMEKQNDKLLLGLLRRCSEEGLITTSQMYTGFERLRDSLDDLALDIPDIGTRFAAYVDAAKQEGWLKPTFIPYIAAAQTG